MEVSSIMENLTKAGLDLGPLSRILRVSGNNQAADVLDEKLKKEEANEKTMKEILNENDKK